MNKSKLVSLVSRQVSGLTHAQVEDVVDRLFTAMEQALVEGDDVKVSRFGTLKAGGRKATRRRSPKDGTLIEVPARKTVSFKPSPILLEKLKGD